MTDDLDVLRQQAKELLQKIGRQRLAGELDVGLKAISNAAVTGRFPPAWFPTVRRLGAEAGVEVPESLFNWRNPEDVQPQEPAE